MPANIIVAETGKCLEFQEPQRRMQPIRNTSSSTAFLPAKDPWFIPIRRYCKHNEQTDKQYNRNNHIAAGRQAQIQHRKLCVTPNFRLHLRVAFQ